MPLSLMMGPHTLGCGGGTLVIAYPMIWMHARVTMLDVAPKLSMVK